MERIICIFPLLALAMAMAMFKLCALLCFDWEIGLCYINDIHHGGGLFDNWDAGTHRDKCIVRIPTYLSNGTLATHSTRW